MGALKQAASPREKMRCAIILFICILSSASSPTAADEYYNQIVPEEEYQEPNDVDFSVDDDILTESPPGKHACAGIMESHAKAQQHENSVVPLFAGALAQQKEVCLAEEKANKRKEEEKKEMGSFTGPTFKFEVEPCKGGKGNFEKKLKQGKRAKVGIIPAKQNNVEVTLKTKKDVDLEVWGPQGKIAIVAWDCANHNKIHKTPTKCLDTSYKKSIEYAGAIIEYSGYNGQNGNLGHEYIKIKGKSAEPLTIQAYAYRAGTAKVDYSWGPDKRECRRKTRAAKKAAKAKHDALIAAEKANKEEKARKEKATKEKADKAEKAQKEKEKAEKVKEKAKKKELAQKSEKDKKAAEKAQKLKKEKAEKKAERALKEATSKEQVSKEQAAKAAERRTKEAEKATKERENKRKEADAKEKAQKAAVSAEQKVKEIKSKKCGTRTWSN